jgi:hypothetical protein
LTRPDGGKVDLKLSAGRTKAMVAQLLDHFHLTLDQIGRLTDAQIYDLYFHRRDRKTGGIIFPEGERRATDEDVPHTLEAELAALDMLALISPNTPASNIEEAKAKLRAKYAAKEAEAAARSATNG